MVNKANSFNVNYCNNLINAVVGIDFKQHTDLPYVQSMYRYASRGDVQQTTTFLYYSVESIHSDALYGVMENLAFYISSL